MAIYELTHKAEDEIEEIYEYSIVSFGLEVARKYISGMNIAPIPFIISQ
jgi:toxin ParE1/3/4